MTQSQKVKLVAKILRIHFPCDNIKAISVGYEIVNKLEREQDKVEVTGGGA